MHNELCPMSGYCPKRYGDKPHGFHDKETCTYCQSACQCGFINDVLDKAAERVARECIAAMDSDYPFHDLGMTSTARQRLVAAVRGEGEQE